MRWTDEIASWPETPGAWMRYYERPKTSPDKKLVEMVELREHPYFVGCQFHPELKSRPMTPHPLFVRFVRAALERATQRLARAPEGAVSTPSTLH